MNIIIVGCGKVGETLAKELNWSGNNVTVHILNLRRRLEDNPSSPKAIRTVWGKGYQVD